MSSLVSLSHYCSPAGEGVISSIGVDGSGYEQYKTGPGLLISFTHAENLLLWVTLDKGKDEDNFVFGKYSGKKSQAFGTISTELLGRTSSFYVNSAWMAPGSWPVGWER